MTIPFLDLQASLQRSVLRCAAQTPDRTFVAGPTMRNARLRVAAWQIAVLRSITLISTIRTPLTTYHNDSPTFHIPGDGIFLRS